MSEYHLPYAVLEVGEGALSDTYVIASSQASFAPALELPIASSPISKLLPDSAPEPAGYRRRSQNINKLPSSSSPLFERDAKYEKPPTMVKPLSFKGDKKPKKRKRTEAEAQERDVQSGEVVRASGTVGTEENADDDDSWVAADAVPDVVGPIMFVLPTDPPAALACDAVGKVFTLGIENIVDANPATAEPHDVRQVWVANRITGTEQFRFKGHHGQYLGCDKNGVLSATSAAVSPLESFNIIATADTPGTFQIQTLRETFLTVKPPKPNVTTFDVRGDEESITFNTTWRIRMQARFKPRLKASKEEKAKEKISRKELEEAVGRRLEDDEVRKLKRARREGDYHEHLLMLKVKGKHDKYG